MDAILALNAGSSSIKFSLFVVRGEDLELTIDGQAEGLYTAPHFLAKDAGGHVLNEKSWGQGASLGHDGALEYLFKLLGGEAAKYRLVGVGHRILHGGPDYELPVRVDASVLAKLETFIPLAPLHQPHNLKPIRILLARFPELPQVACFDTGFHRAQPPLAQAFALPKAITDRGVRRYGFHGLSYEYIAEVLPQYDRRAAAGRSVVLHLGNGASTCAMRRCKSMGTSMGFTALGGLPMGTRSGDLDPGVLLFLMQQLRMDASAIETLLYKESGLLGLSGVSSDMRAAAANLRNGPCISATGSRVSVWVIPTNEELMIASHTLALTRAAGRRPL